MDSQKAGKQSLLYIYINHVLQMTKNIKIFALDTHTEGGDLCACLYIPQLSSSVHTASGYHRALRIKAQTNLQRKTTQVDHHNISLHLKEILCELLWL